MPPINPVGCYLGHEMHPAASPWRGGQLQTSQTRNCGSHESGWLPASQPILRGQLRCGHHREPCRPSASPLSGTATGTLEVNSFSRKADKVFARFLAAARPPRFSSKPSEAPSAALPSPLSPRHRPQQKWQPITPVEHCREYCQDRIIASSRSNCVAIPGKPNREPAVKDQGELE